MVQCDEQLLVCCVDVQCRSTTAGSALCNCLVETCKLKFTFRDTTFTLTFDRAALTWWLEQEEPEVFKPQMLYLMPPPSWIQPPYY